MHEKRFGLRQRPFPATPDCACYYPATGHARALERLSQAIDEQQGIAVLTGGPGTGKTLLAYSLLDRLGPDTASAFLTNSHCRDRTALFQAILYEWSLPYEVGTEQEMRLRLTEFLLQNAHKGRRAVLIVDEAQHLSADLLEELRLLGNLEAGASKAVHVLLVGQESLLDAVRLPGMEALNQRLEVRVALGPLGVEEAADYLLHHLRRAGARAEAVMSEEALELLARSTRGVPRLLNQAARQALALADAVGAEQVDAEVVLEALGVLGIEAPEEAEERDAGPLLVADDGCPTLALDPAHPRLA
jgi:type II secretory pathway predicted ATPase ExeA